MSKAEERALQEYPKIIKRYRKLTDTKENTGSEYDENLEQRYIYIKGYHQAEKDLKLTWEDISTIRQIMFGYNRQIREKAFIPNNKDYCKEVLKRFKAQKEK